MAIFGPLEGVAGLYGAWLGSRSPMPGIKDRAEAEKWANPLVAGGIGLAHATVGLADDIAVPLIAGRLLEKKLPQYNLLWKLGKRGIIATGTAWAGSLAVRDWRHYAAANQYLHRDPLDARVNAIDGFKKKGLGAAQRTQMTGIASPAASSIFYRMENNPFANLINGISTGHLDHGNQQLNSINRGVAFATMGGIAGSLIGARWGLGKASLLGAMTGIAGGSLGIVTAHDPDRTHNIKAIGAVVAGAMPTLLAGAGLHALRGFRGRAGWIGAVGNAVENSIGAVTLGSEKVAIAMKAGLNRANYGLAGIEAQAGRSLTDFTRSRALQGATKRFENTMYQHSEAVGKWLGPNVRDWMQGFSKIPEPFVYEELFSAKVSAAVFDRGHAAISATMDTARMPLHFAKDVLIPTFSETGQRSSRWEQSLAVGHLITMVPHGVLMVGSARSAIHDRKSKKHATNTMPSNSRSH